MWGKSGAGSYKEVSPAQAKEMLDSSDAVLIDVREPNEYAEVHAEGAKLIPLGSVAQRLSEIPTDRDVVLICRSGGRSAQACEIASQAGYKRLFNVAGGTLAWVQNNLPTARGK